MKIYTKSGDKGQTSLASGARVSKTSPRIESYGNIDELNAIVGICRCLVGEQSLDIFKKIFLWLEAIQNDLFIIGSDLATPNDARWKNMKLISQNETKSLEGWIDDCQQILPPLTAFVLPGGCELNAQFHLARTVCRRAERGVIHLSESENINDEIVPYLNRLSDLFFVLARLSAHSLKVDEIKWNSDKGSSTITAKNN